MSESICLKNTIFLSDCEDDFNEFVKKRGETNLSEFKFIKFDFDIDTISKNLVTFLDSEIDFNKSQRIVFIISKKVTVSEELKNIIRFRLDLNGIRAMFLDFDEIDKAYKEEKLKEISDIFDKPYTEINFKTYFDSDLILNEVFKKDRLFNNFIDELEFD